MARQKKDKTKKWPQNKPKKIKKTKFA